MLLKAVLSQTFDQLKMARLLILLKPLMTLDFEVRP